MRRLEPLAPVVREDHLERPFQPGQQAERDERVVAQRRGQLEPAHALAAVADLQLLEVQRLRLLHEAPVTEHEAGPVRVLHLHLRVDDLVAVNLAALHQLRDPDHRVVDGFTKRPVRGWGCRPGATARVLGDLDRPGGRPLAVTIALGRDRDLRGAAVHPGLEREIDPPVPGSEMERALQRDGVRPVHHLDARDVVVGRHGVRHLHDDRDLGSVAGHLRQVEHRKVLALERRGQAGVVGGRRPPRGPAQAGSDPEPHGGRRQPEEGSPGEADRP